MDNKLNKRLSSLKKFKKALKDHFIKKDAEWIDINVTPLGRIDLTIVSNKFEDDESESLKFIESSFQKLDDFYHKGFTTFYSVEDADFSGIKKPSTKKDGFSDWESMIKSLEADAKIKDKKVKNDLPHLISFYSYKGGVGRTLALVQTAYLLAKKGKNVLMLDLDIEAPSLYDIFSNKIELDKGIVDYLYEQEFAGEEKDINIDDIVSNIQVDETLAGNLYTIPAGIMSAEYIYKLTQLKPKFLSRRDYLTVLLEKLQKRLEIDIVLIDSRTGINDWGAFSILDIADEVFFFTYPNRENITGTRTIVDLMKNMQLKKFTVVFSRVEADEGLDYAEELFEELRLEQEFISIVYNPRLAVIKDFPNDKFLSEYQEIADFILEKDQLEINKTYITDYIDKKEVLKQLLDNISKEFYITEAEKKVMSNKYNFIAADSQIIEKRFSRLIDNFNKITPMREEKGSSLLALVENKLVFIEDNNFLAENQFEDLFDVLSYFYYVTLQVLKSDDSKMVFTADNFIQEDYSRIKSEFIELDFDDRIQKIKDLTLVAEDSDDIFYLNETGNRINNVRREINLVINLNILGNNYLTAEKINILNSAVEFIREHFSKLNLKIIVSDRYYKNNLELFTDLLGVYQLEWKKDDLKRLVLDYLLSVSSNLEDYLYAINRTNKVSAFEEKMAEFKRKENEENKNQVSEKFNLNNYFANSVEIRTDYLLNLFWGIRINPEIYSKKVIDYFYDLLESKNMMNPISVAEVLSETIKLEIENNLKSKKSLISKDSLGCIFERY